MKGKTHDLNHDLTFSAHTINCVCHSIRSMFRVLGIYNFALFRYRESDPKSRNWLELPINPPDARKVKIHNLTPRTKYEFQVIGENEFGDGMYSAIIEAQTKGKYFDNEKNSKKTISHTIPIFEVHFLPTNHLTFKVEKI